MKHYKRISNRDIFQLLLAIIIIAFLLADCTSSKISIIANIASLVNRFSIGYIFTLLAFITGLSICNFRIKMGDSGNYLIPGFAFLLITVVMQVFNGFQSYSYRELLTLFVPVLIYISYINVYSNGFTFNVDIVFYLLIIFFIIYSIGKISINNITSISFLNSYSAFESKYAYYALILQFYYAYKKDKLKMIISFIICVLSLKRVAFIFAFILLIFHKFILLDKPVKKNVIIGTIAIFMMAPIMIQIVCNDAFGDWFNNVTGQNLNLLLSGRISKFNAVFDSGEMKYGWGSSTIYLTNNLWSFARHTDFYDGQSINIHSDIIKMYCECSILGLYIFLHCHLSQVKNSMTCYFIMLYLLTDMLVNHHLGIGKALLWIIVYIVINEIKQTGQGWKTSKDLPLSDR